MADTEQNDMLVTVDPSKRELPWMDTGLELLVVDREGHQSTWPICRALLQIGRAQSSRPNDIILESPDLAERQAMIQYRGGKVLFLNLQDSSPATLAGKVVSFCELKETDEVHLGGFRLRLVRGPEGLASLEGYTNPYRGRRWMLQEDSIPIGRPGKRDNSVQLDDVSVSRNAATIERKDGIYWLKSDTDSSQTFVNGHKLEAPRPLVDGDLVQFGQQILRFCASQVPQESEHLAHQLVTILFADIWNYDDLAENLLAEEFICQVSEFYELADKLITDEKGVLTSYLGDALVAIFGSEKAHPDDPARAVRTARALHQGMEALNKTWKKNDLPGFRIGVGIYTGDVILGDVSQRGKSEVTAVGEEAKMASHIEKHNREVGSRTLISQATASAVGDAFPLESAGLFSLEGKPLPMELFQLR